MNQQPGQPQPPDLFSDMYTIDSHPHGVILSFFTRSPREPDGEVHGPPYQRVATIRMTLEHVKMALISSWKQITTVERDLGHRYDIPEELMKNTAGEWIVDPQTWAAFWYGESSPAPVGAPAQASVETTHEPVEIDRGTAAPIGTASVVPVAGTAEVPREVPTDVESPQAEAASVT